YAQAVGGTDHSTINTDRCKSDTGCTPNKITKQDQIQPGNERVNQLVDADRSSICDQRACFAKMGWNSRLHGNMTKQCCGERQCDKSRGSRPYDRSYLR